MIEPGKFEAVGQFYCVAPIEIKSRYIAYSLVLHAYFNPFGKNKKDSVETKSNKKHCEDNSFRFHGDSHETKESYSYIECVPPPSNH